MARGKVAKKCAKAMKPSGVAWLDDIPAGWEVSFLAQVVSQVKERNDGLREKNLLSLSYGKIKRKPIDTIGGLLPATFDGYNVIAANDIVLIILWVIASFSDYSCIPVAVCFIAFFLNDIYGFYSWNKMKALQNSD